MATDTTLKTQSTAVGATGKEAYDTVLKMFETVLQGTSQTVGTDERRIEKSKSFDLGAVATATLKVTGVMATPITTQTLTYATELLKNSVTAFHGMTPNMLADAMKGLTNVNGGTDVSRATIVAAKESPVSMDVLASKNTPSGSSKA